LAPSQKFIELLHKILKNSVFCPFQFHDISKIPPLISLKVQAFWQAAAKLN